MTHPFLFTWSAQKEAASVDVTGGKGCRFVDGDGNEWLDMGSLSYNAHLGHNHPAVVDAIKKQASQLCVAPPFAVFEAKTQAAEKLLALAPEGYTKVFFTLGGAEAVENAMKMARMVSGRKKFISRKRSYHGASFGALSLTGDYRREPLEPVLDGVSRVENNSIADFEETLKREGPESIAAVFMEPVPGANGVDLPPHGYFERVRELCTAHGIFMVFDEVLTGFGRTGKVFGYQNFGAEPDMITVAKGLTAGHAPLGAVLVHQRIAEFFEEETLQAGLTSYAHPLGCAAAVATLDVYESEGLYSVAVERGKKLGAHLANLDHSLENVSRSRHIGLLGAVDVESTPELWKVFAQKLREARVWVHSYPKRGTIVFSPPLIMTDSELDEGCSKITKAAISTWGEKKGTA